MTALVERDHVMGLGEPGGGVGPFVGCSRQPVQEEDARALAAEVECLQPNLPPPNIDPFHAGVRRSSRGSRCSRAMAPAPAARHPAAARGQSASGSAARTKPPIAGPSRKPRSQELVEMAM